jgi:Yip1 domain
MTPQQQPMASPMGMAPPPIPVEKSEISRLAGVFFSPKSTFPDIVRRPRWWVPMILIAIVSTTFIAMFTQRVGWERTVRTGIERSSRAEQMSREQREQMIALTTKVTGYVAYVSPVIAGVSIVVIAAILMFIFNTLLGGDLKFGSMMGIVSYSFLPNLLSGLLAIMVMYLKEPEDFDIQHPLMFNVGSFLPDGTSKGLVALGTSFDLFSFWVIALMAIGIHAAARKIGTVKAFIAILFPWGVIVLLRVVQAVFQG